MLRSLFGLKSQSANTPPAKPSKSILVVGETGGGKSTFINTITNFFRNGSINNLKVAVPTKHLKATEGFTHTENNTKNTAESQTDDCTVYSFDYNGMQYNFIDTPGLNDTRGGEQDKNNIKKILNIAGRTRDLAAVLLIVNGSNNRLTPAMVNIFVTLKGNVPDDAMKNLIVVLSKCDKANTSFQRSMLASIYTNIQKESIFYMNNTAFVAKPVDGRITWTHQLDNEWKKSMKTCKKLAELISRLGQVRAEDFNEVSEHRSEIQARLHEVKIEMKKYQEVLEGLEIAEGQKRGLETNAEKFKQYKRLEKKKVMVKQDTPGQKNTLCSVCDCNCHRKCSLEEMTQTGTDHFVRCAAIQGGVCRKCPKNCGSAQHYHARFIYVEQEQTVETILDEMKDEYEEYVKTSKKVDMDVDSLTNSKKSIDNTMQSIIDHLNHDCNKLKRLCSGFNFAEELRCMYNQLHQEAKTLRTLAAQNAMVQSLNVVKKMIDFHSQTSGSLLDAQMMRPDLDDHDSSDSDDDTQNASRRRQPTMRDRGRGRGRFNATAPRPSTARRSAPTSPVPDSDDDYDAVLKKMSSMNIKSSSADASASTGYSDKPVACKDCGRLFVVSKSEYQFFVHEKGGAPPRRCKPCREKKR